MRIINVSVIAAAVAAVSLSACSSSSQGVAASPSPAAGNIVGTLLVTDSSHPSGKPAVNVSVAIYLEAFSQVGNQYTPSPPHPMAVVSTGADGSFAFRGLAPGRYFLALLGVSLYMPGRWVTLNPGSGASVQLLVCGTCPAPN